MAPGSAPDIHMENKKDKYQPSKTLSARMLREGGKNIKTLTFTEALIIE